MHGFLIPVLNDQGIGVIDDMSVLQSDNSCRILFRQFRVMRNHDNQSVGSHFLQKVHDLHTCIRIQRTGRFIRQQNIRIIHQGTGNGNSLHLSARHLCRFFMHLITEPDFAQGILRPSSALTAGYTADGQRQFHIGQNRLVRDQIVALEHKTDCMVPVGIPVPVFVLSRGDTVDNQISAVIAVQTADNIQKCCLSGSAGTENGNKLVVSQIQTYMIQCFLNQCTRFVLFTDVFNLQHVFSLTK